ncbi:hypothetical protein [Cognatilysobacter lacus]|uniref:Uncharacterized protein n=1 Tax=Cognatilysobacter lacus TaxID=1643323 RepID=A0A5D8YS81_9GAMM|nr:hypothetical protein [Lysobacter lacus]TZF85240.1 hypothetical protein FW784_12370 [Lysobacter lacus]
MRAPMRCINCGARLTVVARSRIAYAALLMLGIAVCMYLTGLAYDHLFAEPGVHFRDLGKGRATLWVLPLAMPFLWLLDRYMNPKMTLKVVPPSIGRPLTEDEKAQISHFGITYNDEYFSFGEADFDHLTEAIAYAQAHRRSSAGA